MSLLVLAQNTDGRLEVAVPANNDVGDQRAVWHRWQTAPNNGWAGWHSLGEPPGGFFALALGANADGRLELVAPAAFAGGDQEIWHRWQSTPGGGWSGWSSLGTAGGGELLTSVPVLARNADGRLELFVVAGDGAVWHRWQTAPNNGWSPWANLGSKAGGFADLGVGTNADGRLELFATAAERHRPLAPLADRSQQRLVALGEPGQCGHRNDPGPDAGLERRRAPGAVPMGGHRGVCTSRARVPERRLDAWPCGGRPVAFQVASSVPQSQGEASRATCPTCMACTALTRVPRVPTVTT